MKLNPEKNYDLKSEFKKGIRRLIIVCLASVLMALNIKSFVRTGGLYPGGATGLSLLVQRSAQMFLGLSLPYTLINIVLNAIPIYIGFRFIGKKFTLYSCLCIVLTSILTDIIPGIPITSDVLLISIFGGLINGFAISMCLMADATTGGTDFISIFLSEKKGMDSWNIILGINAVILVLAGLMFGWDKALYSIIFQFASTQVLHMLYKKYQQETFFIVTDHGEEVYRAISEATHHSATILNGEGPYEHKERQVVYSVVSSAESKAVRKAIHSADPNAFVNSLKTERLWGHFYYKPNE